MPTEDAPEPPQATPDTLSVLVGDDPIALIAAAGLVVIAAEGGAI